MNLGEKIKKLRLYKNFTLEELGSLIGTSKQTLHKYEQGIINNIPKEKIELLAKYLECSPSYLYDWEEESYYLDDNTREIAQNIFENDELRLLFDASKNASPEDLKLVTDILLNLKER